jgi:putative cardiolipin synthase
VFHSLRFTLFIALAMAASLSAKADQIRYLSTAKIALSQITATLMSAHRSIDMAYYIYDPCSNSAGLVHNILAQKAKEGVRVRLLIDAEGFPTGPKRDAFTTAMAQEKIQVRFFNKWISHASVLANNRLHAKLTVVDSRVYISGGRNIGDDYFSLSETINFVDRDVAVAGASASQASEAFSMLWNSRPVYSEAMVTSKEVQSFKRACSRLGEDPAVQKEITDHMEQTLSAVPTFTCANTSFTIDDPAFVDATSDGDGGEYLSGGRLQLKYTTRAVLDVVENVHSSLDVENWAYIPTLRMAAALDKIRDQKLPISIFTNRGVGQIDEMTYLQNYYLKQDAHGSQRNYGVSAVGSMKDRWEMTVDTAIFFVHSKVYVADRRNVVVGSFNLDPRSYHTNVESAVTVKNCPDLAKHVVDESQAMVGGAYKRDKTCAICQTPSSDDVGLKIKAWLSKDFQ